MATPDQREKVPSRETIKIHKVSDLMPINDTGDLENFKILQKIIEEKNIRDAQIDFEVYSCRGYFPDDLIDSLLKRNISLINTNFHKVQRNDLNNAGVIFQQASQEMRMDKNRGVRKKLKELNNK